LHRDEFYGLYSSPNIVRVIKLRRLRWAGGFRLRGPKVRDHWEDLGVGGGITLGREIGIDGANWIRLAQDRVQWRAFVNTVMNLWVP
jgi:hypothetical protein